MLFWNKSKVYRSPCHFPNTLLEFSREWHVVQKDPRVIEFSVKTVLNLHYTLTHIIQLFVAS